MNRLHWKRRIGNCIGAFTASPRRTVILLYHAVGTGPGAVPEPVFREQMAWLAERASIVPLSAALTTSPASRTRVAITFDDGYASLHDLAAPVLATHGACATVFLNSGWIGSSTRIASAPALGHFAGQHFMTWREAAALANAGWTVGSHGVEHLDLTKQDDSRVCQELSDSKRGIESRLARPCEYFAYPWGRFTTAVQSQVARAGYSCAVAGIHGPVSNRSDRFAIPRIDVRAEYELEDFESLVTGRWDFLGVKHRLAVVTA